MSEKVPSHPGPEYRVIDTATVADLVPHLATERKAALQLLIEPGETIKTVALRDRLNEAQTRVKRVTQESGAIAQLLKDAHTRCGALQPLDPEAATVWEVYKPRGSRLPDAVAGHLLGISRDFKVGLERLFGNSRAPEGSLRAPQAMLMLADFFALQAAGTEFTFQDVADGAGIPYSTASVHLCRLAAAGWVELETTDTRNVEAAFTIEPNADPLESTLTLSGDERQVSMFTYAGEDTYRKRTGKIVNSLKDEGYETITYEDIIARFERSGEVNRQLLRQVVGRMVQEGILTRLHPATSQGDAFSRVRCTRRQKQLMDRISRVFNGLEYGDEDVISEGLRLGQEVITDSRSLTTMLRRANVNSSAAGRQAYSVWTSVIEYTLRGRELSTEDLRGRMVPAITTAALRAVLHRMRGEGLVTSRKENNAQYWRLDPGP